MKTEKEILDAVRATLRSNWSRHLGEVVPETDSLRLYNDAIELEGAVLYADLAGSSKLTQGYKDFFVAEIYKLFLMATSDVIRNNDGEITAFDGDRVMSVFIGPMKCTNAAKTALQISAITRKINVIIGEKYANTKYRIDYGVGIDFSHLFIVRTGVRGANDLAWIGDASNVAAKLSNLREMAGRSFITKRVFDKMADSVKYANQDGIMKCMWAETGKNILGHDVYQSTWYWDL